MPKLRYSEPERWKGATEFTAAPEKLGSTFEMLGHVKSTPYLWNALKAETTFDHDPTTPRMPGDWALVAVGWVLSGHAAFEPFYQRGLGRSPKFWKACGFVRPKPHGRGLVGHRPSYPLCLLRLHELEQVAHAFTGAVQRAVQQAVKHEPRIGTYTIFDSCDVRAHCALIHDKEFCAAECGCDKDFDEISGGRAKPRRRGGSGIRAIPSASSQDAARARHRARDAEENVKDDVAPDEDELSGEQAALAATTDDAHVDGPHQGVRVGDADRRVRVKFGSHWYRTLDPTAGLRIYTDRKGKVSKVWIGYYAQRATDAFMGLETAMVLASASRQEYRIYPDTFAASVCATGRNPLAMLGDRGFAISAVYEYNTRRGVASVMPTRDYTTAPAERDYPLFDRDGIPRCAHCTAETTFVRFSAADGIGRLWFRCAHPRLDKGCGHLDEATREIVAKTEQSLSCAHNFRRLLPLWRTHPVYKQLEALLFNREHVHRHGRDRYAIAGNNLTNRLKLRGIGAANLRAQVGMLCQWLAVLVMHGWLGEPDPDQVQRATELRNERVRNWREHGRRRLDALLVERRKARLHMPYGPDGAKPFVPQSRSKRRRPKRRRR